ncbi:MAG: SUF system NifU family Fe-S cluster assembly protein [Candidatus Omnitrophica bacterium]|nr:SUF system NifU family Fe-S cluster assembly protein [Candidatus Omnitrophota bacterium]
MSDLRDLYQEVILEHNNKPRNFRVLADANRKQEGFNPLCGDRIQLYLRVENGQIKDIGFQGSGCAISKASASLMTSTVKGKSEAEAVEIFEKVHGMLAGQTEHCGDLESMGRLGALSGVCEFPARVKCASLAWHTLKSALENKDGVTSTE